MKLFRAIIFYIVVLLLTSVSREARAFTFLSFQQTTKQTDTSGKNDLHEKIQYGAVDSTITDKKTGIVYLYGKAKVIYQDFQLDAEFIKYDTKNRIIFASGITNKAGRYVGKPIFKMGGEGTSTADSLIYNTETRLGKVYSIYTAQQGGFFSGGKAKVQPDNEAHIQGQTFSTCNLPHPHYGIYITKGIVTETQIITGPFYFKFEDIPMPFGLPFGFFPKPNKKSSGFILPTPNQDATRGFSLNGGGYYLAFNDNIDGRVTTNVYTNGSFDVSLASMYLKRYKYNGNIGLSFSSTRNGLEGTPEYKPAKNFSINWQHSQNANARPGTTFSASVNAASSGYGQVTADAGNYNIERMAANSLNSSISYGKVFGKGINFTAALGHSQEIERKTVTLNLPTISLSAPTFNPFDPKDRVRKQRWYEKISLGYSMSASNSISTTEDQLFKKESLNKFQNGMTHTIPISLPFNVADYFNFNASSTYVEKWYLQTYRQRHLINSNDVLIDTVPGFRRTGEYGLSMNMTTKLYGTKQFRKMGNVKAIRHILTPGIGFSYRPDFSKASLGYYKDVQYYTNDLRPGKQVPIPGQFKKDFDGTISKYSIFEGTALGSPSRGEQANINFTLENNVELKVKSRKDTTNGGEKKIPIIQGLSFTGFYNFLAKGQKLSPISFGGRSQFSEKLGFNFGGSFNAYALQKISDTVLNVITTRTVESNQYVFKSGKLPRLTSFNLSFDYSLNPEAFKSRNRSLDAMKDQMANQGRTPDQIEQLSRISRDPNAFVDFNVPWNIALSYSLYLTNTLGKTEVTNTLNFNGDLSLTPKWKIQYTSGYDFKAKNLSYTSFSIYRDLHCWDLSANWIPFGTYASYSITIKVKEAILQDLKLSKRKGYYTRY